MSFPPLPSLDSREALPYFSEAADFLTAGRATCDRLLEVASTEAHPLQREDILRSALVFGSASLDRVAKSVVERGLPPLVAADTKVEERLARFAAQHLGSNGTLDMRALATVLLDPWTPRQSIMRALVADLTGGSLQSFEELMRVAGFLRVDQSILLERRDTLREAFAVRNQIVHEMDLAHDGEKLDRRERPAELYFILVSTVITTGDQLILGVSAAIERSFESEPFFATCLDRYRESGAASDLPTSF